MPSQLATVISFLFIIYLFLIDRKNRIEGVSRAIYIPFFWMLFAGSRSVSQWLNLDVPIGFTTTLLRYGLIKIVGNPLWVSAIKVSGLERGAQTAMASLRYATSGSQQVFGSIFESGTYWIDSDRCYYDFRVSQNTEAIEYRLSFYHSEADFSWCCCSP